MQPKQLVWLAIAAAFFYFQVWPHLNPPDSPCIRACVGAEQREGYSDSLNTRTVCANKCGEAP